GPLADAPAAPAAAPAPAAGPQAPAVLMADAEGVRVLQAPGTAPSAQTEIQLDAITYDLEGEVTLAGRGPADGSVRVTLNNQPINMGEIGPGGQWSLGLPDVDPGTYTLRLEQLTADGTVTRTVTTPFLREDPARIRENPMLVDPGASVITVQRGFTLWGIAEANFGDGILYVQIFEENRGEIRDPDMIFPGQIFALPDLPRTGGGQ
ncbi:LysM peptidoglycan-binding domain-containing protein, partial [Rhodobacterales bacterium HKCCSP123]|nr:LysM peptidoglycan-binding domain-containing protein [Rhodobacterales bacterium HKCCSP123]